jgi:hypothetical protein
MDKDACEPLFDSRARVIGARWAPMKRLTQAAEGDE